MQKIIVTGGLGFIGSHTVVELQQAGFEVVIVDNLSNSRIEILNQIELISGQRPTFECFDLTNEETSLDFFKKHSDAKGIIHFAAFKAVGESVEYPLKYYKNNLVSLINVLEGMEKFGIKNLVFSSSCTVYGQPKILPVNELAETQKATSPYGNTKQIAEEIISDYLNSSTSCAIALRYFNPIGAHESALIGELPIGIPNNLVPFITQTAAGIRAKLLVYGDDYSTQDGTAIRDYIHVVDLAKAHIVALKRMIMKANKTAFELFNIGTGVGYSVLDVIHSFEKTNKTKLNFEIVGRRDGDVEAVFADTTLAELELGWKAEKTLDEMTKSAWNWQQTLDSKKYFTFEK